MAKILDNFNNADPVVETEASEVENFDNNNIDAELTLKKEEPKEDTKVLVDSEFLKNLMERVESLEGKPKTLKRINDHIAFVRLFNNKIVTGVKKFWTEKGNSPLNDQEEKRLFAQLIIKDGKEDIKVDWLDFLNDGVSVKVKIIKEQAKEKMESHGQIMSVNLDEHNNKNFVSKEIDLGVVSYEYLCKIQIVEGDLAGQEFIVNSESLNI